MNRFIRFPLGVALSVLAATAVEARGPSPQPWLIYPAKTMASCQAGTAPTRIAERCDELLARYARELEACMPRRNGGPVTGPMQVALQQTNPDCTVAAAKAAAEAVK